MLLVNQLAGLGVIAPASPAVIAFAAHSVASVDASTYTFSAISLGTASSDRYVVAAIHGTGTASRTISSVTIGGVSATEVARAETLGSGGYVTSAIYIAAVPTGATGDVVVTWSGAIVRCAVGTFALTGLNSATATDTASATGDPASTTSLDIQAGGVAIACYSQYVGGAQTNTWTGLTERYDASFEDTGSYTGACDSFESGSTGPTISVDPTGATLAAQMVCAAFR